MGRRRSNQSSTMANHRAISSTIREMNNGEQNVDVAAILRTKHIQRLAIWASKQAKIPNLAAFYGERFAEKSEDLGIAVEQSSFLCQRCETILQPGINCTIRIEKNSKRKRKNKKSVTLCQNMVVYTCNFCSHRNLKWGTAKGHVNGLVASRESYIAGSSSHCLTNEENTNSIDTFSNAESRKEISTLTLVTESLPNLTPSTPEKETTDKAVDLKSQITPLMRLSSRSAKKRKASGSTANKTPMDRNNAPTADSGNVVVGSSKRKRKGWSSLKEMVESNDANSNKSISNFAIPFLM